MNLHCFKVHRSYSISFNLFNCLGLNPRGLYLKKKKTLVNIVLTYSIKRALEIRKFHVTVMQQWLKRTKKHDARVKSLLCFCRAFSFVAPNSLPEDIKNAKTVVCFKSKLKTHLFRKAFLFSKYHGELN